MKYLVTYEFENPHNPNDRRGRRTEVVYLDADVNYRRNGGYSGLADWFEDKSLDASREGLKLIIIFAIRA